MMIPNKIPFLGLLILSIILFNTVLSAQDECEVLLPALSGSYEGKCKKGMAHGHGIARGTDTYTGNFKKGLPHGKGKYEWSTGEIYEGDWKNGVRDGVGSFTTTINDRDTILAGLWVNNKYEGPVPEKPKVIRKYNVDRITFYRRGDGERVEITFYLGGNINPVIMELTMVGNSGSEYSLGRSIGYENIQFPFECKVTYSTWNALHTVMLNCRLEFEISQPGFWVVKITN